MALITTTTPNSLGEVAIIVKGKEQATTKRLIANYIQRTNLKVTRVIYQLKMAN